MSLLCFFSLQMDKPLPKSPVARFQREQIQCSSWLSREKAGRSFNGMQISLSREKAGRSFNRMEISSKDHPPGSIRYHFFLTEYTWWFQFIIAWCILLHQMANRWFNSLKRCAEESDLINNEIKRADTFYQHQLGFLDSWSKQLAGCTDSHSCG